MGEKEERLVPSPEEMVKASGEQPPRESVAEEKPQAKGLVRRVAMRIRSGAGRRRREAKVPRTPPASGDEGAVPSERDTGGGREVTGDETDQPTEGLAEGTAPSPVSRSPRPDDESPDSGKPTRVRRIRLAKTTTRAAPVREAPPRRLTALQQEWQRARLRADELGHKLGPEHDAPTGHQTARCTQCRRTATVVVYVPENYTVKQAIYRSRGPALELACG